MVWEALFLLVILKIPVVYLCLVVWWAIRAEATPEPPTTGVPVSDTPLPGAPEADASPWAPRPRERRRPANRAPRRPVNPRLGGARAEAGR